MVNPWAGRRPSATKLAPINKVAETFPTAEELGLDPVVTLDDGFRLGPLTLLSFPSGVAFRDRRDTTRGHRRFRAGRFPSPP